MIRPLLIAAAVAAAMPAAVMAFERVKDRGTFVGLVSGRALTSMAVSLRVTPEGGITGRAFGQDVTGSWTWRDGLFCREMKTRARGLPTNCQVVERQGDTLRFIADAGTGATADLRLR